MDASKLTYDVIESRHVELRRVLASKDLSHLTERQAVTSYSASRYYSRCFNSPTHGGDPGYVQFYDMLRSRYIYITSQAVGLSHAFHIAKNVHSLFHLILKNTNHEDFTDMTQSTREWWIDNMCYVAIQMSDTEGNIVLLCNNGRTRSPMYLVSYLIFMYSMSVCQSMNIVGDLLKEQRDQPLDRHRSLVPIAELIYNYSA